MSSTRLQQMMIWMESGGAAVVPHSLPDSIHISCISPFSCRRFPNVLESMDYKSLPYTSGIEGKSGQATSESPQSTWCRGAIYNPACSLPATSWVQIDVSVGSA